MGVGRVRCYVQHVCLVVFLAIHAIWNTPIWKVALKHALDPRAIAQVMKAAQDEIGQVEPLTSQLSGFDAALAYDVAHLFHETRFN